MIYLILWIFPHFATALNLKNNYVINILSFSLLLILIFIKPTTYDLSWYYTYFELVQPNVHEYGFEKIISIYNYVFQQSKVIHLAITISCLLLLFFSFKRYLNIKNPRQNILLLTIIIGSIFFVVGSQNNIRMFLALSIGISSLLNLYDKQNNFKIFFLFLLIFSCIVHWSTAFFLFFILFSFFIDNFFDVKKNTNFNYLSINIIKKIVFFSMGIISVVLFFLVTLDKSWIYFNQSIISNASFYEAGRSSNFVKLIYIIIAFSLSSLFTFNVKIENIFVSLRGNFLFFIIPFSFAMPVEGFARLIFVYFAIEFVVLIIYSVHPKFLVRMAFFSIFLLYGFAMNAINIVSGINYNL